MISWWLTGYARLIHKTIHKIKLDNPLPAYKNTGCCNYATQDRSAMKCDVYHTNQPHNLRPWAPHLLRQASASVSG